MPPRPRRTSPTTRRLGEWIAKYKAKFNNAPDDYTATSYDATLVIIAAVKSVADAGKSSPATRVRDAIQTVKSRRCKAPSRSTENGDIMDKVISVFQAHENKDKPMDDTDAQFKYIGVAPQS